MNLETHWNYISGFLTKERIARFDEVLSKRTRRAVAILENTMKEQNASAVIRTMDALGFQELHMVEPEWQVGFKSEISRGSDKWLDIQRSVDLGQSINSLKERGYAIAATTPHESGMAIQQLPLDRPIAVIFGNEWEGISSDSSKNADYHIQIPMYGFVESYNLSVSVAMIFSHLRSEFEQHNLIQPLTEDDKLRNKLKWGVASTRSGKAVYQKWLEDNGFDDIANIITPVPPLGLK
ncbi:TrmH family RNA methyltransferase [Phaeocystidibacter luteus]|uniref:tRNA (guanosine(18)-2'-O)-methyltransferase n=1 Tax=Phaeocystidibacter luteus TaxID=911197 RepID=A0A6N6RKW7_9FLAO|nr:RNA methyltransferase [Phaeocystidibacter luteus]KAB2809938.1 RNA methyltransferase [Phaeocystidibacter luteus]